MLNRRLHAVLLAALSLTATACSTNAGAVSELPKPAIDLPTAKAGESRTAVFAGGCFWTHEAIFEHVKGVTDVTNGYAGGAKETAHYDMTCTGNTGHAESIKITYDASQITYGQLLRIFFDDHDPTTLNAQGADSGTEYRSVIFVDSDEQRHVAEAYIAQLNDAKVFASPIVTTVDDLTKTGFYPAEDYHQNYADLHPDAGYIQYHLPPKLAHLKERHPEVYRDTPANPAK